MRSLMLLPFLLALAGCWQPRYFSPRENLNGRGPNGEAAAVYRVMRADDPEVAGEVRLWSSGAEARFADDDEEVVDLHLAFEVENNGSRSLGLELDSLTLEELVLDGYLQEALAPHEVRGSGFATPGTTARVDVIFRPATTYPGDLDSFRVRFGVRDAGGSVLQQVTPFSPVRRRAAGYGAGWAAGWGPGWGPGWGWGWGAGLSFGRGWGGGCRF